MDPSLECLQEWERRISATAESLGLDCFPQEFELCDHREMIGYMAYSGMPSHYPHWSYGKAYEKMKTLYDYGVQGLPYEMVINSDPCLAYLMADNSVCLNLLTIAHVYGHNDFFKNNFTFSATRPEFTISSFKSHSERVRSYVEDPSIGLEKVEYILDAAHALSMQCRRDLAIRKLSPEEQADETFEASLPRHDPHPTIHRSTEYVEPDLRRLPLRPEEDMLLFIRDYNPYLSEWEKDLLTIVHEEAQYFIPQIETKIMNEGWASFWHYHLMNSLELPDDMRLEFMVHHNQVLRPNPGALNPYHVGFKIWERIFTDIEGDVALEPSLRSAGRDALFETRESARDRSFLRRFLDKRLIRELGLFEYGKKRGETVVTEVADDCGWEQIKETLVNNAGMAAIPVITIEDADHCGRRGLLLKHREDSRELDLEYAEKTLAHLYRLWGREISLQTVVTGRKTLMVFNDEGLATRSAE